MPEAASVAGPDVSSSGKVGAAPSLLASQMISALQQRFALAYDPAHPESLRTPEGTSILNALLAQLEHGGLFTVTAGPEGRWVPQRWVREALMAYVRASALQAQPGSLPGSEMDLIGWSTVRPADRRIPAGSFVRRGAYVGAGATVLPPSTLQLGACVMGGALVDAHCLIGSCVRLEKGVRVGCGTMIGGFLTPVNLLPIVLEEDVVVGGNCGIYGSVVVGRGSVLEAGTVLRSTAPVYDARSGEWLTTDAAGTLWVPPQSSIYVGVPPQSALSQPGVTRVVAIVDALSGAQGSSRA